MQLIDGKVTATAIKAEIAEEVRKIIELQFWLVTTADQRLMFAIRLSLVSNAGSNQPLSVMKLM